MAIEQQLHDLTAATRDLHGAILRLIEVLPAGGAGNAPAPTKMRRSMPAKPSATPSAPPAPMSDDTTPPSVSYETDVRPLFLRFVAKRGRDKALDLIKSYKPTADRLDEAITPDQYAEVIEKLKAAL